MAKTNYKEALWKAGKEPLRLLALAVLPIAVTYFTELSYEWAGIAIVILRFVDKWLHETKVAEKGLTRF